MVVHRLLAAAISLDQDSSGPSRPLASNKELEAVAQHINKKNQVGLRGRFPFTVFPTSSTLHLGCDETLRVAHKGK